MGIMAVQTVFCLSKKFQFKLALYLLSQVYFTILVSINYEAKILGLVTASYKSEGFLCKISDVQER